MPVTFAHPAAVLPLRRTGLPMPALIVGSMVPDLTLFVPSLRGFYDITHSLVGIATVDLVAGSALWWLWWFVLAEPTADAAPASVRRRLPEKPWAPVTWLVVPAVVVGAVTHVVWDAFTHQGRWGVALLPWLAHEHAGLAGYQWAQYGSGVVGMAVVLGAAIVWGRRQRLRRVPPRRHPRLASAWWAAPIVAGLISVVSVLVSSRSPTDLAFGVIIGGAAWAALAVLVVSVVWHAAPSRNRAR